MSMRTNDPRSRASATTASKFARQSSGPSSSPSAVGFTEMFEVSPSSWIRASTSW